MGGRIRLFPWRVPFWWLKRVWVPERGAMDVNKSRGGRNERGLFDEP